MLCRPVQSDGHLLRAQRQITVEFADGFRVQASRFAIRRAELRPGDRPLMRASGWRRPPKLERKKVPRKLASKSIDYAPGCSQYPSLFMTLLVGGQTMKLWEAAALFGVTGDRARRRLLKGWTPREALTRPVEPGHPRRD